MQADKRQPWRIYVHAKAKNLDFKFRATNILPTWRFSRFSILLKLPPFLLKVKSKPEASTPRLSPRTLKSKFLQILEKFRARRTKKQASVAKKPTNFRLPKTKFPANQLRLLAHKEPVCVSSLVVGNLALLFQSISEKDQKKIVIYSSIFLLHLAFLFNKFMTRRTINLLVIIIVATVACSTVFDLKNHLNYDEVYVSEYVWKVWNCAAFSGCL